MKLKDEKLNKLISKANLPELEYRLGCYEDDSDMKAEGMNEWQYVMREVEWILEDFQDDGHTLYEELQDARWLLRKTDYGKRIPISSTTFRPLDGFQPFRIETAKNVVNEYNRTKRFAERLRKMVD